MKNKLIVFILLAGNLSFAQSKFKIEVDYARFSYNDTSGYVEFYCSFYQDNMKILDRDHLQQVSGLLNIQIQNIQTKETVVNKNYQFTRNVIDSTSEDGHKSLIGLIGFQLPFGNYSCNILGKDANDQSKEDSIGIDFKVLKYFEDKFSLSDLQVAGSIKKFDEPSSSIFYKNTYEVIPNPSVLFGVNLPVLFFYSEMYNLDKDVKSELLKVEHILISSINKEYYHRIKNIPRRNNSIVEIGAINISKIPSGIYTLILSISDTLKNLRVNSSKRLFIYNPGIWDSSVTKYAETDVMASEFFAMNENELNEVFKMSRYISSKQEIEQWEKLLDVDGKKNFLFKFWKSRDLDPLSPQNEAKIEYFKRAEYSNANFTNVQRQGWRTDRGRTYMIYGEPSEIERYPNQTDSKPYEIWKYNQLEGGVIFVFADLTGFSDYTFLHSTLRGELRDDNWARKITIR